MSALPLNEYQQAWRLEIHIPCCIDERNVEGTASLSDFGSHVCSNKQSWFIILLELVFDDSKGCETIHPFEDSDIRISLALSGNLNKGVSSSTVLSQDSDVYESSFEPCCAM
jgi:hypothetical protein